MSPENAHTLVLVRHGETTGESSIRLNGATDVPLSTLGQAQMRAAGQAIRSMYGAVRSWERIVVSPLVRSRNAVPLVWPGAAPSSVQVVEGFREIDFGAWEGRTYDEVRASDPAGYERRAALGFEFQFPHGESLRGFAARVERDAQAEFGSGARLGDGAATLAILHKGTIKGILRALLGLSPEEAQARACDLGSIHVLVGTMHQTSRRWCQTVANQVGHLGGNAQPSTSGA